MFNDAALAPIVPAGIFKEIDSPVNGRPAWISKNSFYAIWYVPDDNSWVVGSSSSMGNSGFVYIKGEDAPCPQEVTSWRFYNGAELEIANAGDIMMECKPERKYHYINFSWSKDSGISLSIFSCDITVMCIKVRTASFPRFWKNHP